jgi:putative hydrolase of the HAD superfamily
VIEWLLVDYGEVLSTPPPDDTITELAALAGQNPAEFLQRYWQARPGYDLGQPAARYWPQVLGRDLADQPPLVDQLTGVDVRGWLRLNCLSLRTLLSCTRRTGSRLALLSNAPEPLATAIDRCHWTRHFTRRFYSCRLGHAKPDPAVSAFVLAQLAADPDDVLFINDRAVNTDAAAELGMRTITFTSASALQRELRLTTVPG